MLAQYLVRGKKYRTRGEVKASIKDGTEVDVESDELVYQGSFTNASTRWMFMDENNIQIFFTGIQLTTLEAVA